jgi:hypothetical protein
MVRFLTIALLLLSSPVMASEILTAVPGRFLGIWAGNLAECGRDEDNLNLRLEGDYISYWESGGPIKSIVVRGSDEIAMIAELSGEGETWLATPQFRLSPEGDRLIDESTTPGEKVVRYRCPPSISPRSNNSFKPNLLRKSA